MFVFVIFSLLVTYTSASHVLFSLGLTYLLDPYAQSYNDSLAPRYWEVYVDYRDLTHLRFIRFLRERS